MTRGWLGVTIQDVNEDLADYYGLKGKSGAMVADVVPGDPADRAGIKPKDIITQVNGKAITNSHDLTNLAASLQVGDTASVTVLRNGKPETLEVKIGRRPLTIAAVQGSEFRPEEGK